MAEDEAGTIRTLGAYRTEITNLVADHRGRVADFTGDNFLSEFPTALDAVECAVEVQRVLKARNASLAENRRMEFCVGLHLGDVAVEGERLYGDGVNIASRLEGLAEPGGVCISGEVHSLVESKLDASFEDLGDQTVKNIPKPVRVYRVLERAAEAPAQPRWGMPRAVLVGSVAVLVAFAVSVAIYLTGVRPTPSGSPITAIAVLPFDDMSPDSDQKWLADGMALELIETLSRIKELRVPGRTSSFSMQGEKIRTVGAELNVGSVVEGSVRRSGDALRVTAQLIRVADGYHLWSARYDRQLSDVFAVQAEIARAIAEAIIAEFEIEHGWLRSYEPSDVRAYELVMKGAVAVWPFRTREGIEQGIENFEQALAIDPNYSAAHAWLGWAYQSRWELHGRAEADLDAARAQAKRALALDPTSAGGYNLLAYVLMFEWQWERARQVVDRGIEHNPGFSALHVSSAFLLMQQGRIDEAIREMRRAVDLDPRDAAWNYLLGAFLNWAGEHEAGLEVLERAWELAPGLPPVREALRYAYHLNGMDQQALEAWVRDLPPELAGLEAAARRGFEAAGFLGVVRRSHEWLVDQSGKTCTNDPDEAGAHLAILGERDAMFECLDEAIEQRTLVLLKANPMYAPYRNQPRFTALLRRMKLAE